MSLRDLIVQQDKTIVKTLERVVTASPRFQVYATLQLDFFWVLCGSIDVSERTQFYLDKQADDGSDE